MSLFCITQTCLNQYEAIIKGYKMIYLEDKQNIFSYFAQNIVCGYTFEPPYPNKAVLEDTEYPQSLF